MDIVEWFGAQKVLCGKVRSILMRSLSTLGVFFFFFFFLLFFFYDYDSQAPKEQKETERNWTGQEDRQYSWVADRHRQTERQKWVSRAKQRQQSLATTRCTSRIPITNSKILNEPKNGKSLR